jgi:serine/threonine protein kinase
MIKYGQGFKEKANDVTMLHREIAVLKKTNHPNIVKLFEVIGKHPFEKKNKYLKLKKHKIFSKNKKKKIF